MKRQVVFIVLLMSLITGFSQTKEIEINKLIGQTQAIESTKILIDGLLDQVKAKKPDVPEEVWQKVEQSIDYDEHRVNIYEAYNSTYSLKELIELNEVFASGNERLYKKKNDKVMPLMYKHGNDFGAIVSQIIVKELEGY